MVSSSATDAVCGSSSLIHGAALAVPRELEDRRRQRETFLPGGHRREAVAPFVTESGKSLSKRSRRAGLWSNNSICEGAPDMNR